VSETSFLSFHHYMVRSNEGIRLNIGSCFHCQSFIDLRLHVAFCYLQDFLSDKSGFSGVRVVHS
jgi:hypothetical protein